MEQEKCKKKIRLFDSGIFIDYISKEYADANTKSGFIEKIDNYTYKTNMTIMGKEKTNL